MVSQPRLLLAHQAICRLSRERGRPRLNSDICARHDWYQALTGLNPKQLLEDADTGEIIWQHQAMVDAGLVSLLNKMVRYHFKDRYQSATEASAATTSRALLTQQAAPQPSLTATALPPAQKLGQDNMPIPAIPPQYAGSHK